MAPFLPQQEPPVSRNTYRKNRKRVWVLGGHLQGQRAWGRQREGVRPAP